MDKIAHQTDQARISINRIREVNVTTHINRADILCPDGLHDETRTHTGALQGQMDASLAEIGEIREQQDILERRLMGAKHSDTESSTKRSTRCK